MCLCLYLCTAHLHLYTNINLQHMYILTYCTCLNCSSKLQADDGSPPLCELWGVGGWEGRFAGILSPWGLKELRKGLCPACLRSASRAGRPDISWSPGWRGRRSERIPILGFISSLSSRSSLILSSLIPSSPFTPSSGLPGPEPPLLGL